ncbi:MAG TPA: hypothetical protein VFH66_16545 [Mycobacteriales bacterium]|nr:hypothetical protein [Mycobacteriales bacterium]
MCRDAEHRRLQAEADRYRQAAQDALEQLDWCIGYLHGCHKGSIAAALGRNRSYIRKHLMGKDEQPTPSGAGS